MQRYLLGRHSKLKGVFGRLQPLFKKLTSGSVLKNIALAAVGAILLGAIALLILFAWYSGSLPNPDEILAREVSQSTKIYDRTGEHLLYEVAPEERRTLVTIEEIPDIVEKATITAEDRSFYEHSGISIKGIMRAIFSNIIHLDPTGQGASTITQQFVKKAVLYDDQTIARKVKEIIIALALEKKFEKDQILQLYLNEIPYGGTNFGVEAAAQAYFDKSVRDATLGEAATLAALPNRPSTFVNNPDLLVARKNWILDGMVEEGYISQEQADAAKAEDNTLRISLNNIEAPHFVLWVKELLEEKYDPRLVETGGLKVVTTLDYEKQVIAEEAVKNGVTAYGASYGFTGGGLLALDPKNGHILSMVGSPDYFNDEIAGQVNVTTRPLQPGSSIKPIVYAAAFERGYTPNTLLWDVNTTFPTATGPYEPKNYDLGEHGVVSLRKALQGSLNIPAVKTLYLVGIENAIKFAQRLGYSTLTDPSQVGLSMVLGGAEVELIDHTAAYAVFANGGTYHEPVAILKVEKPDGEVLEEWKAEEHVGNQAISANLAATMSNVLSDNGARAYVFGPNNYLTLGSRPVAAKTGTTNEYKDAWTMGYTPSLVTGVWVGNANGVKMNRGADGSKIAAPIWNEYMSRSLKGTPIENFPAPQIPTTGKAVIDGLLPATTVTIDTASGKLATDRTPERFRQTVQCGEYHSILHYVSRADPLGSPPTNPASDSNYNAWESSVQDYIVRHNASLKEGEAPYEDCEVPTEEDDVHVKRNEPSISIEEPGENANVGRTFAVELNLELKRSFSRVEYAIDGTFISTSSSTNGATITLPGWVGKGKHTLKATVYDDVDNSSSDELSIDVDEGGTSASFRITNPFAGQTIEKTAPTYSVALEIPSSEAYSSVTVTATNLWTGEVTLVGESSDPQAVTSIAWTLPAAAQYSLAASAKTNDGEIVESAPITVIVKDPLLPLGIPIL